MSDERKYCEVVAQELIDDIGAGNIYIPDVANFIQRERAAAQAEALEDAEDALFDAGRSVKSRCIVRALKERTP